MDMNSFLSWGTLGTFAGATACTGLFTQLLKSIIKKVPTQWLSFLIALVLLTVTTAATGGGCSLGPSGRWCRSMRSW